MGLCEHCEWAILCPSFGDIKCMKRQIRITEPSKIQTCEFHKKSKKLNTDCNCNVCQERGGGDFYDCE